MLEAVGVRADILDDLLSTIDYTKFERLVAARVRLTNCDHIGLLIGRHTRLADFGLPGRFALCGTTAGKGLRSFIDCFNLNITATTVSLDNAGAVTISINILQELLGRQCPPCP